MKKTIWVMLAGVCLFFCSCAFSEYDEMELTNEDLESARNSAVPVVSGPGIEGIETLSIYTIDNTEETLVPLKIRMSTDRITPAFLLDEVIQNIDVKVEVTEINVEKSRLVISFDPKYAPVKECSKKFETLILDCISNSLLDNLVYIDSVVFRSGEDGYQSENYRFGVDEVYSAK